MKGKFETLGIRLLTGIVFIGIVLGGLFFGSVVVMEVIFGLLVMIGIYEYQQITETNRYGFFLTVVHSLLGGYLFVIVSLILSGYLSSDQSLVMLLPYTAYVIFYTLGEMFRTRIQPTEEVAKAFWGHIYIAMPFALLMSLYLMHDAPHCYYVLPIFVLVWLNDTGAYLVGSMIGKRKLLERISPKKTIEGTIGGVLFSILGGVLFSYFGDGGMTLIQWVLFGFLVGVFATLGDLYESFLKRSGGVKDSGWILPGHGGVLDRVDSLIVVSVIAYFYYLLV